MIRNTEIHNSHSPPNNQPFLPVQHARERSNGKNHILFTQLLLKLVSQTGNTRVVTFITPSAPLLDTIFIGSIPIAIQLPMHVFETHIDQMHDLFENVSLLLHRDCHTGYDIIIIADILDMGDILHNSLIGTLTSATVRDFGTSVDRAQNGVYTEQVRDFNRLQKSSIRLMQLNYN